ncbi:hypothetical protein B4U80_11688 [Leptotrombidium deliense]|uniref:Peptidase A2 domain-containing protein n=1 Tax=Leptotrombidium deliense TaxID=299467 RepID=A0A443S3R0_9ACAR|nr:hypothetical protein B4U80_11688 [Leptotrombidium deliense]
MLVISAHINHMFTNMIVDTGGGCSVVDADLAKLLQQPRCDSVPIEISLISGQLFRMSKYITATITYENSSVNLKLYVVEKFPYPVLLGINWCRAARVKIDFSGSNDVLLTEGWVPIPNNYPLVKCAYDSVDVKSSLVAEPFEQKLLNIAYVNDELPEITMTTIKDMADLFDSIKEHSELDNCVKILISNTSECTLEMNLDLTVI